MASAALHHQPQNVIPFPVDRKKGPPLFAGPAPGPARIIQLHPPVEISRTPELAMFLSLYHSIGVDQQAATRRSLEALAGGGDPNAVAAFKLLSGSQTAGCI